ncbi:putative xenobiotic-transporting ATPase [Cocos nucifera]|nr:putative xenobiotic-transporting ATPase [Cocos nucifera]
MGKGKTSIFQLFTYADIVDRCLMFLGIVGCIGDGMMTPLIMLVLSSMINAYGTAGPLLTSADIDKIPNILSNVSGLFSAIIVAFTLSWRLTLASLPSSLCFIVPGVVYGKLLMKVGVDITEAYGIAGGIAEQAISSIRTVVSYVGERKTLERFKQALERATALGKKQGFVKGVVIGSMGMVYAVWSFDAWFASYLVIKMGAKGGHVFVASICVIIMGGLSIISALPNVKYLSEATTAASRLSEMIEGIPPQNSNEARGETIEELRGEIKFKNVFFTYPSRPHSTVLCGLNLKVAAGQTIGLVGASGSGKSTVISLIQRFYTPDKGKILLDGHNIRRLQLKWLRSQMGLVSQEPILFATSIKENMLFGNEEASMDLIVGAAKAANAHDFITKLPNGYDTNVGQFGFQMSGGQKQRIAIARALIRNPKILLLDEATSALDAQSERLVRDALDQAAVGRTTIIVAHRLTTLEWYNYRKQLPENKLRKQEKRSPSRTMSTANSFNSSMSSSEEDSFVEEGDSSGLKQGQHKHSKPSQWRLMKLNKPEWKRGVLGSIGAVTVGASGEDGIYSRMVQLQKAAAREQVAQAEKRSPSRTMSTANSFNSSMSSSEEDSFVEEGDSSGLKQGQHKHSKPSQWRLMKLNKPEWKRGVLGSIGAVTVGAILPINSLCLASVLSVYFLQDDELIRSKTRLY